MVTAVMSYQLYMTGGLLSIYTNYLLIQISPVITLVQEMDFV